MPESWDSYSGAKRDGSDPCVPIFHYETRVDEEKSEETGKRIYKRVPYVEIISPGNDKERVNRRVKDEDKRRWPEHWARFEKGEESGGEVEGTPITEWPQMSPELALTLQANGVQTVEQFASVADIDVQSLGIGMMNYREKARTFVEMKAGEADVQKVKSENRALKSKLTKMEKKVASLTELVEQLAEEKADGKDPD